MIIKVIACNHQARVFKQYQLEACLKDHSTSLNAELS